MHLMDKRLFQFGDSLYSSLEKVDGFAAEIEFEEMMDSAFAKSVANVQNDLLSDDEVKVDKSKLDRETKALLKKLRLESDKLSKKELKKIRDYRVNQYVQKGEMETIVDGFLYGIAKRQGKWIGGIEDISDQLGLSDELGGELSVETVLRPEVDLKASFESLVDIYLAQDLNEINRYTLSNYSDGARDLLLIKRNIKMARRMDSLSAIRTMFFAVGAAHLPGDSGVIRLLRERGFQVDPVFSTTKISADLYANKLKELPWIKVDDDQKLYTIEMPGSPSKHDIFGAAFKMNMFYDITTMTYYAVGSTIGGLQSNTDMQGAFKKMMAEMGGRLNEKIKYIKEEGITGAEATIEAQNNYYKIRLLQKGHVLYIIMAGGNKLEKLTKADVTRYFTSFKANEIVTENKDWVLFNSPEKAFSVIVPGKLRANKIIDKAAEGTYWIFETFDYLDNYKGLYYLLQIRDIGGGYFLDGDSNYFNLVKEQYESNFDVIDKSEHVSYKGYPAFVTEGQSLKDKTSYKCFNVIRGNRVYSMVVGGASSADFSDADKYFNSLTFLDYATPNTKTHPANGFFTTATSPFVKVEDSDSTDNDYFEHYYSFNSHAAISYDVTKEVFPVHYWAKSDSAYFESKISDYHTSQDSVLSKKIVTNGALKGIDVVVKENLRSQLKKVRVIVNGDTLYTLFAYVPAEYIDHKSTTGFFDDFRFTNETPPVIYKKKIEPLFEALRSMDSAKFEDASEVFHAIEFGSEDLPVLHQGLTHVYKDSSNPYGIYSSIADEVIRLKDKSTIEYIRSNYSALIDHKDKLKYEFLGILATFKSDTAYDLLKELLSKQLPGSGSISSMSYALRDSIELTTKLLPDLLPFANDSLFVNLLTEVSVYLLDSQVLSVKDLHPYQEAFYRGADRMYIKMQSDDASYWSGIKWIELLRYLNTQKGNDILQKYLQTEDLFFKMQTILALLKNNQPVEHAIIEKVAADPELRVSFFDNLKKTSKAQLFPKRYATQIHLSESEIYNAAFEEIEIADLKYIGERKALYKGANMTFYLYKVGYSDEEDNIIYHLGVAGPFDPKDKELKSYSDVGGIYWDIEFDSSGLDNMLKSYLLMLESYSD
ncbi:MAG TPA: TraB/GumN family protein [Chitinophagaceae bacterium]